MIVYHGSTVVIPAPDVKYSKDYKAMYIYYESKLSRQIAEGSLGIENMDYKYLAEDLIENESKLF